MAVHNHDIIEHEVSVEVFNSDNKSIMQEFFKLAPESYIVSQRPLRMSLPLTEGEYQFMVTVDNETTKTALLEVSHPYDKVVIRLYEEDVISKEITPISMHVALRL